MSNDKEHYKTQSVGALVDIINQERVNQINNQIFEINNVQEALLKEQQNAFNSAIGKINNIRDFLKSPENILGNENTKHGEIAEVVEVNIRNARSILEQKLPTATFDGVGRIAPVDYIIDGHEVQSKFVTGLNKNLDHVLQHMEKYTHFGKDSSYYHIPKDHHDSILKIVNEGKLEGFSEQSVSKILQKVQIIEKETGKSFDSVIKPSISEYKEVQKGVIFKTIDGHEEQLGNRNEELKNAIQEQSNRSKSAVLTSHSPSWGEAAKIGAIGAGIGAGFGLVFAVYKKYQEGKTLSQFNSDDWADIGVDFVKGGCKGGITGVAVYGLTNFANMGAPLASAFVSTFFGIADLSKSYMNGQINSEEFIEHGQILCFESAAVALGATIGQTLIPIPIVGSLLGTFASKIFIEFSKKTLGEHTAKLKLQMEESYSRAFNQITKAYQRVVQQIIEEYERLGELTKMAFDFDRNAVFRFDLSITLALELGVEDEKILHNIKEVDDFMLS